METRVQVIKASIPTGVIDVLTLGDSIDQAWDERYWRNVDPKLHVYNMGVSGFRTQQVLWLLSETKLTKLTPKWVTIIVGTNNMTDGDSGCAIGGGVSKIASRAKELWPHTKILIVDIPPRGQGWKLLQTIREAANTWINVDAKRRGWETLNVDALLSCNFTQPCQNYLTDLLHPAKPGYELLTKAAITAIER